MTSDRYFLDMLNEDSVSVRKQTFVTVEGVEYPIGDPWRRAYVNSASGRMQVMDEVPDPYKTAIFAVWGDEPLVHDPVEEEQHMEEQQEQ